MLFIYNDHLGNGDQQCQTTNIKDDNVDNIEEEKISRKKKSRFTCSTVRLKMQRKFEKFKARRKRKAKEAGVGIKYSSLKHSESKTYKAGLKRLKSIAKTKPKEHKKHRDSTHSVNSSEIIINPTNQMRNLDFRPLVIEI